MATNKRSDVWNYFGQKVALKAKHLMASTSHEQSKQSQSFMDNVVKSAIRQCLASRVKEITDLIADTISTDMLPLSLNCTNTF